MNIQKKKWAVVVEVDLTVPHHIKNQAVISTGTDRYIIIIIINIMNIK